MIQTLLKDSILSLCEEVANAEQLKILSPGTIVASPGDMDNNVYIIKTGVFKLGIESHKRSLTIEYLFPGYIPGLINHQQRIIYPCKVTTVMKSSLYVWERKKILELMSIIPEFSIEINKAYSEWGNRVVERIKSLVFLAPYQRVASWIYDYNKYAKYKQNKVWSVLSLIDMAEFCNVTVNEFESSIKELARNKVISYDEKDCLVKNWDQLSFIINSQT